MRTAVFVVFGLMIALLLGLWLKTRLRYEISSRHLKVVLFGIPLRRVRFESIVSVSKRRGEGLAERWFNTLKPSHRILVLRRRGGLFRNFMITPRNRYVFRSQLLKAMEEAGGPAVREEEENGEAESAEKN